MSRIDWEIKGRKIEILDYIKTPSCHHPSKDLTKENGGLSGRGAMIMSRSSLAPSVPQMGMASAQILAVHLRAPTWEFPPTFLYTCFFYLEGKRPRVTVLIRFKSFSCRFIFSDTKLLLLTVMQQKPSVGMREHSEMGQTPEQKKRPNV